jgi:hypothetical protein
MRLLEGWLYDRLGLARVSAVNAGCSRVRSRESSAAEERRLVAVGIRHGRRRVIVGSE